MGFTCPYCYDTHEIKDCSMICSYVVKNGYCPDNVSFDSSLYIDKKFYKKCLNCTRAKKDVYCPESIRMGTNLVVPMRCVNNKGIPIALVGAKATGKSNYIGVLVNEIRKRMTSSFDCSITMNCDKVSKEQYDEIYYRPLFIDKQQIGATDSGFTPPMIFPIDFRSGKQVVLTFYDTAGENFDDKDTMINNTGYLSYSKGIILLIDPLQIQEIRDVIGNRIPLPEKNTDAIDILDKVIDNIENFTNNSKKPFDMPLALVFTKIDAFDGLDDIIPADSYLRYDSEYLDRGVFIKEDFENTQQAMKTLLDNFLELHSELQQKLERRFKRYAFFGLSALGGMPDDNGNLSQGGIKPRRVLDPLLWILSENNYIKTVKR